MFKLAVAAASVAAIIAGVQTYRISLLTAQGAVTEVELRACGARLSNLIEDLESDNAIDNLPDDALTDVPPHWLLPPRNTGGD